MYNRTYMNKYILIALVVYILLFSGCSSSSWQQVDSGASARTSMLKTKWAKHRNGAPSEAESYHLWRHGRITQKEFNEHRELRNQPVISMSPGSYGQKLPEWQHHESFGSFLLHILLPYQIK